MHLDIVPLPLSLSFVIIAAVDVVDVVYFNLDNINQISIYKNLWGCTIRVSEIGRK